MNLPIKIEDIPESAINILRTLQDHQQSAFLVGGCVRDLALGLTPNDFDICTSASPDDLIKLFPDSLQVGAHFGIIIENGIQIATFRSDGVYSDHRRPDSVEFVSDPYEDSCRRDFTINSLMYDPFEDKLVDFHRGVLDLACGIIRAVGQADDRFEQDYIRMLRAIRFAAKFNFMIEEQTFRAIIKHADKIESRAVEMIRDEFVKMFSGPNPELALDLLIESGLLKYIVPELCNLRINELFLLERLLGKVGLIGLFVRLSSEQVSTILIRLKFSAADSLEILNTLILQREIQKVTVDKDAAFLKRLIRKPQFTSARKLYFARIEVGDRMVQPSCYFLLMLAVADYCDSLFPEPILTGNDLIAFGLKPGPSFRTILFELETAQLNRAVTNREQAIELVHTAQERLNSVPPM